MPFDLPDEPSRPREREERPVGTMEGHRRRLATLVLILGLTAASPASRRVEAADAAAEHLYQARVLVTGQREDTRAVGLARALGQVLAKVSGDPRLPDDPRVAEMAAREAGALVLGFRYRDLLEGVPVHDEQGTRDRPHELTADFDPARIDATLRSLGSAPWTAARPRLVVFLRVRTGAGPYVLAGDGERGRDQREALADAAYRFGVPATLPTGAALAEAGLTVDTLPAAGPSRLDAAAREAGGDLALSGSLTWSEEALGWVADWRLAANGGDHRWGERGVGFDEAFRRGVGGAARILSGGGEPD